MTYEEQQRRVAEWTAQFEARGGALGTLGLAALNVRPTDPPPGPPAYVLLAEQGEPLLRALAEILLRNFVDAVLMMFRRRGAVPLVSTGYEHSPFRCPLDPLFGNAYFLGTVGGLSRGLMDAPADIATALLSPAGLQRANDAGPLIGCMADLPTDAGARVRAALLRRAADATPDHPLAMWELKALMTSAAPAAWQALVDAHVTGGVPNQLAHDLERIRLAGQLGCAKLLLETHGKRWAAIPINPAWKNWEPGQRAKMAAEAALALRLLDAPARRQAARSGPPDQVVAAVRMEATLDMAGVSDLVAPLLTSPDADRRAWGLWAYLWAYKPAPFSPDVFDDPAEPVVRAALAVSEHVAVTDVTRADVVARLLRVAGRLKGTGQLRLADGADWDVVGPKTALAAALRLLGEGPKDILAPHVRAMDQGDRAALARRLGADPRPLSPVEVGMLGALAADRVADVKAVAGEALARRGITADAAASAAKSLKPPRAAKRPKDTRTWVPLFQKQAEKAGGDCQLGAPASEAAVAAAEARLGTPLHPDLRALYLEADGATIDGSPYVEVADLDSLIENTEMARESCTTDDARRAIAPVAFITDYGTGDYAGLAATAVGKFAPGTVLEFDHETGKLRKIAKNLKAYITRKSSDAE